MGLKSLFKIKKKRVAKANYNDPTPVISRSSSINSRARIEEELEQVFKKFDVNGDGKICSSELGSIMASLGNAATEEELLNMIREVDADGDGFIDLQEFIELNTKDIDSDEVSRILLLLHFFHTSNLFGIFYPLQKRHIFIKLNCLIFTFF